jgi:large subunit ribosomal protein L18Ae
MAGRHSARTDSIQIIRVEEVATAKCRRPHMKQFHNEKLEFPHPVRVIKRKGDPTFTKTKPKARLI